MNERKQKRSHQEFLGFGEPELFVLIEPEPIEIASGYSISVKYDRHGRPLISVKKYGDVDTKGLRREIERNYPGAVIHGLKKPKEIVLEESQKKKPRRYHTKNIKRRKHV